VVGFKARGNSSFAKGGTGRGVIVPGIAYPNGSNLGVLRALDSEVVSAAAAEVADCYLAAVVGLSSSLSLLPRSEGGEVEDC